MSKIFGYMKGLHAVHLLELGNKPGLFRQLASAPAGLSPEALTEVLGLHEKYVRLWCETVCALELLDYEPGAGYRLAPCMEVKPDSMGKLLSGFDVSMIDSERGEGLPPG